VIKKGVDMKVDFIKELLNQQDSLSTHKTLNMILEFIKGYGDEKGLHKNLHKFIQTKLKESKYKQDSSKAFS